MSSSTSSSRVTISLNLVGQKASVDGLTQTATAVRDLGVAVRETAAAVAASMGDMDAATATGAEGIRVMAVTSEDALAALVPQVKLLMASMDQLTAGIRTLSTTASTSAPSMSRSLSGGLGTAKTSADGLLGSLTSIKVLLAGGFAYGALKQLNTYSSAQVRLQTLGGLSSSQATNYAAITNAISKSTGASPSDVMSAAYNPVSEGFSPAVAKQVLTDAAQISQIGGAPLSGQNGTSYALSTLVQNLYGGEKGGATSSQIAGAYGLMMATVGAGDMDVAGFLAANGTGIWNTASAYGILPQTTASYLAFMSSQGVRPDEAGTRGRMAISMLASPSGPGRQIEAQLGIKPTEMLDLMHGPNGLSAATLDLVNHMNKAGLSKDQQAILMSRIFGGARTDASILAMVNHSDLLTQFDQRVGQLSDPAKALQAWNLYTQSPAYQFAQLTQSFQELEIEVGKGLLPAFKTLVQVLKPILAVGSTRVGSDAVAGLLLGATLKKVLGALAGKSIPGSGGSTPPVVAAGGSGSKLATVGKLAIPAAAGYTIYKEATQNLQGKENALIAYYTHLAGGNLNHLTPAQKKLMVQQAADIVKGKNVDIPQYARGGVTDGPMAIVGEGSAAWPEYIVPTDPAYRARALALFQSLGGHLLGPGVPQMLIAMGVSKSKGTPGGGPFGGGGTNVSLGQRLAAAYGWAGREWTDLYQLWQRESGWSNTARNSSSGAYGIPQALPATKLPLAGQAAGGSSVAAQIAWGLQYVRSRYGDPAGAWAHEQNFGWYARGGILPFASYDTGGFLPEGFSIAHNGTGAPEPVGHGLVGGDLHVTLKVGERELGEAIIRDFRKRQARL